ncbi:extracellular solute-binding protein [Microbacterium sp. NPDC055683]
MPSSTRTLRVVAGLGLVGVLALAGCGRADDAAAPAAADTVVDDSAATGTVSLWAPDGDAKVLDEVLAPFLADNPDLDLEITLVPEAEYETKLRSAIAAGTGPDLAQLYPETETQFLETGAFAAVPDGLVDAESFFAGAWDSGVLDGAAYSVPWYSYTYTLVYRADLAEAAGVDAPATWDETVPFFEALQSAGAERGLGADIGWDKYTGQTLAQFIWQAGGSLLSDDGTAWTLDTPETVAAIEYNASFFTSDVADLDGPQFLDAQPYFVDAKTAASITGPWVIGQLDEVAGEDGWTAEHVATAPLPSGDGGSIGALAGGNWGVLADSDAADAAWKLIRHMADSETQLAQYAAYGSMPAVAAAWDDPAIADQPLLDAFYDQLQTAQTYPASTTWPQIAAQLGTELEQVAKGQKTAEQAAADIQSFADGLGTGAE